MRLFMDILNIHLWVFMSGYTAGLSENFYKPNHYIYGFLLVCGLSCWMTVLLRKSIFDQGILLQ